MAALVPFNNETTNVPAFLKNRKRNVADLKAGVGSGVVRLSIEGKRWTIVRSKEDQTPIMNPKDPESYAGHVNLVIIKAAQHLSRAFYEGKYERGKSGAPDCASVDGVKPDTGVPKPQAKSCAVCPHSVYGTGENGKGFRCSNARRLAVANPAHLDEPMLLNVPGGSLKNLAIFADLLDKRGVDYDQVITKFSFDPDFPTQRLIFEPVAFVTEEMYAEVQQMAESSEVENILGVSLSSDAAPMVSTVSREEVAEAMPKEAKGNVEDLAEAKAKKASKKAEPKPEPEAVEEEEAAEPAPKKAAAGGDDLDDLLADFDD